MQESSESEGVQKLLRGTEASANRFGRRNRHRQRFIDIFTKNRNLLFDVDLREVLSIATHALRDIMRTYRLLEAEEDDGLTPRLDGCEDLVQKWFINSLAAIVFASEGQRRLALSKLQVPTNYEHNRTETTEFGDFVSLRCHSEKTEGSANFLLVMFSIGMRPFVEFHRNVVRAHVKISIDATAMKSRQITTSITAFMTDMNKRDQFVTSMTTRARFATSMMHPFRGKRVGNDLSQDKFLELLANRMKTSGQQLWMLVMEENKNDEEDDEEEGETDD
ncbi:hypothetical protein FGB62_73g19 [Gracilaria domingensis]|nr:hypothetical protein FGB62_73g19 [Gracilaria domingensis]